VRQLEHIGNAGMLTRQYFTVVGMKTKSSGSVVVSRPLLPFDEPTSECPALIDDVAWRGGAEVIEASAKLVAYLV
jgi:hypothetical protein